MHHFHNQSHFDFNIYLIAIFALCSFLFSQLLLNYRVDIILSFSCFHLIVIELLDDLRIKHINDCFDFINYPFEIRKGNLVLRFDISYLFSL